MTSNKDIRARGMMQTWNRVLWIVALVAGAVLATLWMRPCFSGQDCSGGSYSGLAMGIAGLAFIVVSILYKLRRDWPRLMAFHLEQWLYAHTVLGVLSLYLVVGHSGFHLRDPVAVIALAMLALTVVSGAAGLFILYFMPRAQAKKEIAVLIPDDLCRRISRLHEELSELCSEKGGVFLEVFNEMIIPLYRTDVGAVPPSADVSPWAQKVQADDHESFMVLASKAEEVHDLFVLLGRHMKFRWIIRGWLLLHVPSTIGLIVFSVVHIISMTWYGAP